jgi:hypothetical protein
LSFHLAPERFKGFSGPVGSGKSLAFCHEALKLAYLNGRCFGLIGAPTYPMLRDSTRATFLDILVANAIPHTFLKAENVVYLPEPDSTVLFRSLDDFERLRGTNLAWFGVDELTYSKREAWSRLEARLRAPRAKQLCGFAAWTPKGFDWVYRRFVAHGHPGGYSAVIARPAENTALPADFYERLKESYDERFYRQEVLGEYLNVFSGQAYHAWDRAVNLAPVAYDPAWPLCWALDFNIDPMCSVLAQVIDATTRQDALLGRRRTLLRVIDELALPDTRTVQACAVLIDRLKTQFPLFWKTSRAIQVYGDASGDNRHSSSKATDWQQVRECLRAAGLNAVFRVPNANPPVRDRVNAVNAMLRNSAGESRMQVDPRCRELVMDFEEVSWKRDSAGNPLGDIAKTDPRRTHLSDALGYLIAWECPVLPAGGPRSEVIL